MSSHFRTFLAHSSRAKTITRRRWSRLNRLFRLEDKITPTPTPLYPNLEVYRADMPADGSTMTVDANHDIRYTTGLSNYGVGPFDLRADGAIINNPDGTESIVTNQRVYLDDNNNGYYDPYNATTNPNGDNKSGTSYIEQLAGTFTYHPTHGHMHFDQFAIGRLRLRPADNSLGAVVATGPKTSFCLEDLGVLIDPNTNQPVNLPGRPSSGQYSCAATFEGISIGWRDIYSSGLDGQYIDVTNIPNGNYWLEIECDYANHIQETNETDNISRAQIVISNQPATGFLVMSATPVGAQQAPTDHVDFAFNQAVGSFPVSAVTFTGPPGQTPIAVSSVQMLDAAHARVNFSSQGAIGTYNMTLDPTQITNASGKKLDQNNNGTGGEVGDGYTDIFAIPAPNVQQVSPSGSTAAPVGSVRVTYNRPMSSATFTTADILSFTGPGGDLLGTITGVTPVTSGGQSTAFDISFTSVSNPGAYAMVIGPEVQDPNGNFVDQNNNGIPHETADQFTTTFTIPVAGVVGPDTFGYTSVNVPLQSLEILNTTGAQSLTFSNTDDGNVSIPLGTNSFNFYGQTYTGSNQLYVGTNGMVTFGQGSNAYTNGNLANGLTYNSTTIYPPTIAPLWSDLIKGTGSPQALYRLDDLNGDTIPDRLIIEWNQVWHYSSSPSGITFQAVLQLNTGNTPGQMLFNYPDLDTGDGNSNGASATVGIRANGQGASNLQISLNGSGTQVGANKAILVSVPTVSSISRLDPNPASDGIIHYQVTFSNGVTGVDSADFAVTTTGNIAMATVIGVMPTADAKVWQVLVDTHTGSGTVRLDLVDNDSIISTSGAKLGGAGLLNGDYKSGEVYTIVQQPPKVFYVAYQDDSAQRSRIDNIRVTFDHPVTFAGAPEAAFQIVGPNGPIALSVDTSLGTMEQTVAKLTFSPGPGVEFGSLMDGNYTLKVIASQVNTAGVALDGDGNGTGGDDYTTSFYRLFGDITGDRSVATNDFTAFRAAFNSSVNVIAFDFNNDGAVSASDFVAFSQRFNSSI